MAKSYWRLPDEEVRSQSHRMKQQELEAYTEPSSPRKQLPKLCKNYKTYKGFLPPKCSGGEGCQVCWLIYEVKNGID